MLSVLLELDESLVGDDLVARGFGVTVVNAAVEWVPPSMRNTASTGPISDADYAASLDESVDDDTTADAETVAVDHAVRQQLNAQLPTNEPVPVPVPVPAANTATPVVAAAPVVPKARSGAPKMTCRKCRAEFDSRKDLGNHMRSDWHRHNLKRHLKSIGPVSEEGFHALTRSFS